MRSFFLARSLPLALATFFLSCGGMPEAPKTGRVLNWWNKEGEVQALSSLFALFARQHPDEVFIYDPLENSQAVRAAIRRYWSTGRPPESFQANGGWDLLSWVLFNESDDSQSKLEPLDDLARAWVNEVPAPVLSTVRCKGRIYGVPLDIHRVNTVFYNRELFDAAGIALPLRSRQELFDALAALRKHGVKWPFALGTREPWTLSLVFFENLLVAQDQGRFYRDYLLGKTNDEANAAHLGQALADLTTLLSYSDPGKRRFLAWNEAASQVARGEAGLTIMGDWAQGSLSSEETVGSMPTPGTEQTFVFTTDTFSLPKGVRNRPGARAFLTLVGSREGQDAFNGPKGSLSPRGDEENALFREGAERETRLAFKAAVESDNLIPATAVLMQPAFITTMDAVLGRFADPVDGDGEQLFVGNESVVRAALRDYDDLLGPSPCER